MTAVALDARRGHHPLVVRMAAVAAAVLVATGWIGKGICRGLSRDLIRLD